MLLLGALGTATAFVAWLYVARRNLDGLAGAHPRWSRDWIFLAWLLPGANLVMPGAVVADVARASAGPQAFRLAWAWWTSLIGSALATVWQLVGGSMWEDRAYMYMYGPPSDRVDPAVRADVAYAVASPDWSEILLIGGPLAVAAVCVVMVVMATSTLIV